MDRKLRFVAVRKIEPGTADAKKRDWRLGIKKKWFLYFRAFGKPRWRQRTDILQWDDRQGEGITAELDLMVVDEGGNMKEIIEAPQGSTIKKKKMVPEPSQALPEIIPVQK